MHRGSCEECDLYAAGLKRKPAYVNAHHHIVPQFTIVILSTPLPSSSPRLPVQCHLRADGRAAARPAAQARAL